VTVNVYAVPPVSPVTVMVPADAPDRVPVFPPGLDVAVYFVMGVPPLDSGAVNATVAVVFPVIGMASWHAYRDLTREA
jgi:uncharacterized membrane protein